MTHRTIFLLAPVICLAFSACDPAFLSRTITGEKPENLRMSYHQDVCFGSCEVYGLDVYSNGLLVFKGERYTDRPGIWHKTIGRREVISFLDSLGSINFKAYPRTLPSRLPDAPTKTLTWYDGAGQPVPVSFKEEVSPELRRVAERLQGWANLPGYRQMSETLTPGGPRPTAAGEREEIIVHLQEGADAGAWVVKYGKQGVALKNRISPNGNYYLITANPNLMAADELLDYLRRDEQVLSAQKNGTVSPRGE